MKRKVKPFYRPFGLIIRQIIAIWAFKFATRWPGMLFWLRHLFKVFRISAGSTGIGCFGIDYHYVFELTSRCNLNCRHCHAGRDNSIADELTTDQVKSILDSLAEIPDFKLIVFSGGEPMLREDIYEILRYAKDLGLYPMLATNATLINQEAARKLKESGMLGIATSIDSTDPQKHNEYRRGDKTYQDVIEGIENVRKQGLYIQINITISDYNIDELEDLLLLADSLEAHVVLLYQFVPTGSGVEIENTALSAQQFHQVIERTHRMQKQIRPVIAPVGLPEYFVYLTKKMHLPLRLARHIFKGCTAGGRGMFYIKPNGDVWPCPFVPVKTGNLLESTAKDIWQNSPIIRRLARRDLKEPCRSCRYLQICGGCRARAYAYKNDLFAADPRCCFNEKIRSENSAQPAHLTAENKQHPATAGDTQKNTG